MLKLGKIYTTDEKNKVVYNESEMKLLEEGVCTI
jgi:hypothetical protein